MYKVPLITIQQAISQVCRVNTQHTVAHQKHTHTDMFKQALTHTCSLECIDSPWNTHTHTNTDPEWTPTKMQTHYATPPTEGPGCPHTGGSPVCANSLRTQLDIRLRDGEDPRGPQTGVWLNFPTMFKTIKSSLWRVCVSSTIETLLKTAATFDASILSICALLYLIILKVQWKVVSTPLWMQI